MKTINQKRKSFRDEMEKLKKENKLKEEKKSFYELLKKAVVVKKKPSGH
jgi:hypothetical protein